MAEWEKVKSTPNGLLLGNFEVLPWNKAEFLIVSLKPKRGIRNASSRPGVYRYNICKHTYKQIIDFKIYRIPIPCSVTINSKRQIIYGQFAEESSLSLWKLHLNELDWDQFEDLSNTSFYNTNIIHANKNIHIIETGLLYKHFIVDEYNHVTYKHNIGDIQEPNRISPRDWGNTLSLLHLDQSILSKSQYSNFICKYSLIHDKWTKWDIYVPFLLNNAKMVHTKNCQYLLLIPQTGNIWMIDMKTEVLTETRIKVPLVGSVFKVIVMKCKEMDQQLCYAFVNVLYRKEEYQNLQSLPNYLLKLINTFVSIETLHLLSNRGHWKICIDAILSNIIC